MRHTLRLNGVIVGHSELEQVEQSERRARGKLRAGIGYELVQPVFRLFARAVPQDGTDRDEALLERYYKARDSLPFELQDASGRAIRTSAIHIADYTIESGPQALELDVLIPDDEYWRQRVGLT